MRLANLFSNSTFFFFFLFEVARLCIRTWLKLKVTRVHGHDSFISISIPKALFPFFYLLMLAALVLHLPLCHNNITVTLAEMGLNVNFALTYFILETASVV
jgi:hypothetical protein